MYVIRPTWAKTSPRLLAQDLDCETRYYPNHDNPRVFDYTTDFSMAVVHPRHFRNAPVGYEAVHHFMTRNKYGQRRLLSEASIPTPPAANSLEQSRTLTGDRFVVRPLRHERGLGYRVTSDRSDFRVGEEYISELYPKRREYRLIFVRGEPTVYINKQPEGGRGEEDAWGVESLFQTITDIPNSYIGRTDCARRLGAFDPVRYSHICAADILYNPQHREPWVCLELNFCPDLKFDRQRRLVVQSIRSGRTTPAPAAPPPNPRIAEIDQRLGTLMRTRDANATRERQLSLELSGVQAVIRDLDQERDRLERERATL